MINNKFTPNNEAAQLIHSSHLPLSADNSPARRPRPVFISTAFLPDGA